MLNSPVMALEFRAWDKLPYHILVNVFSYLHLPDRNRASRTCRTFSQIFQSSLLWKTFRFRFDEEADARFLRCVEKYGKFLQYVYIELDQGQSENRANACKVINVLQGVEERRLRRVVVRFTGENPCFYNGREFTEALSRLFGPAPDGSAHVYALVDVDLSGLGISLDDQLLDVLSKHNPALQQLHIQNKVLVSKVSPAGVLQLTRRCRQLRVLRVFSSSLNDEVLVELATADRQPLELLACRCRRDEKYSKELTCDAWRKLRERLPGLRVALAFDHTCPSSRIVEHMKPDMPVSCLILETFTYIYDEVNRAACCYRDTLEEFYLHTPMSRNAPELNKALIRIATECKKLHAMHVYCTLDASTVDHILELCPTLKERRSYTLRHKSSVPTVQPPPANRIAHREHSDVL